MVKAVLAWLVRLLIKLQCDVNPQKLRNVSKWREFYKVSYRVRTNFLLNISITEKRIEKKKKKKKEVIKVSNEQWTLCFLSPKQLKPLSHLRQEPMAALIFFPALANYHPPYVINFINYFLIFFNNFVLSACC